MSNENIEKQIDEAVGAIKEEQSWLLTYADMMTLLFASVMATRLPPTVSVPLAVIPDA